MSTHERSAATELRDAALVHAARAQIDQALVALAARPLDEAAAAQMQQALGERTRRAREALARLAPGRPALPGPRLVAVPDDPTEPAGRPRPVGRPAGWAS